MADLKKKLYFVLEYNQLTMLSSLISGSGRSAGEGIGYPLQYSWFSLVAQLVKNLPAMLETWVRSLGWDDPLEEGKKTHFSIVTWRIPWTEEPGKQNPWGHKDLDMTEAT